jgi:hypothetical protein
VAHINLTHLPDSLCDLPRLEMLAVSHNEARGPAG